MRAPRVLLIVTLLLAGCVTGGAYREFDVHFAGAEPAPLAPGADDAALLDTVAWLLANRLALPFPETVKGYVYVNEATFVEGLIERHSSEALHEFLRRIGRERGAWGSVFATSYAEFVDEFRARLQRLE